MLHRATSHSAVIELQLYSLCSAFIETLNIAPASAMSSPLDMASRHDLEDTFNAMRPHFEDKETEQNWHLREKDVAKLRRITTGNAPKDYRDTYLTGIKSLLEGIIKVIKSLVSRAFLSYILAFLPYTVAFLSYILSVAISPFLSYIHHPRTSASSCIDHVKS